MKSPNPPFAIRRTETFLMKSSHVGDELQIYVQLPRSYAGSDQSYPTLYVTDGDDTFTLLTGILHALSLDQAAPEMILVAIGYGADSFEPGNQRNRDLPPTHSSWPKLPGLEGDPPQAGGGGEKFLRFLREELIPHIEKNYRADPANRAYVGISFGGLFGVYVLFHHPEIFRRYIISSPALWWDEFITLKYEAQYANTHNDLPARVYLSAATQETIPAWESYFNAIPNVKELAEKLTARKYPGLALKWAVEEGGHVSAQPGALTKGVRFIFAKEESA